MKKTPLPLPTGKCRHWGFIAFRFFFSPVDNEAKNGDRWVLNIYLCAVVFVLMSFETETKNQVVLKVSWHLSSG